MATDASPEDWHLRSYRPSDLDAVYEICVRTGDAGGDASDLVEDPRLFGDLWAIPYVTLEPEHAHLLDDGTGTAIGYVLGTVDAVAFEERCEREWWPAARARHPLVEGGDRLDDLLVAMLHHRPPSDPAIDAVYPSELHIDLLPVAQGRGWGRRMIAAVLDSLRAAGSSGVQLGTSAANARAIAFYEHLGFERLTAPDAGGLTVSFGMRLDQDRRTTPTPAQEDRP